jgi:hypothetical protein
MGRVPRRSPAAAWQKIEGEMVVLQADAGELIGLNPVGARVWELIDGARTVEEIIAAVAAEFRVAPDRVAPDVEAFLAELSRAALIAPL